VKLKKIAVNIALNMYKAPIDDKTAEKTATPVEQLTFSVVVLLPLTANVKRGSQVESQTLTPT
jgi:hypothetical protein